MRCRQETKRSGTRTKLCFHDDGSFSNSRTIKMTNRHLLSEGDSSPVYSRNHWKSTCFR